MGNIILVNNSLRRKFILIFVVLILLTLAFSAGLSWQVGKLAGMVADTQNTAVVSTLSGSESARASGEFIAGLQQYLVVMALSLTGGLFFCMCYFLRLVILPLEELKRDTSRLADGKIDALEHLVATTSGPIKAIVENIHDLAINLQEVLLLVWNFGAEDLDIIKKTVSMLKADNKDELHDEIVENLSVLNKNLLDRQDLVQQFDFFNVSIQAKKVFAGDDSADFNNCEESCHG
ncbi:MAG: hypothetical protein ABFS09_10320 [Thermodesulfobacteriota bacterium]